MQLVFCLLVLLFCQPLFADSSSSRPTSSKALNHSRRAEKELAKMTPEATLKALSILERLYLDPSFKRMQVEEKHEILLLLSGAYQQSGAYDKQEALIYQLLQDVTFRPYWFSLRVHLARSYLSQDRLNDSFKLLKELARWPKRKVSSNETDELFIVNSELLHACKKKVKIAESLFQQEDYTLSIGYYETLFQLSLEHYFPQTFSPEIRDQFQEEIAYRLASCYYFAGLEDKQKELYSKHTPRMEAAILLQLATAKKQEPLVAFQLIVQQRRVDAEFSFIIQLLKTLSEKGDLVTACKIAEDAKDQSQNSWHKAAFLFLRIYLLGEACKGEKELGLDQAIALYDSYLSQYPEDVYCPDVRFLKGVALWQKGKAGEAVEAFEQDRLSFFKRDELLFFKACAKQALQSDARAEFQEIFTNFSDSPYASESYFRYFPESAYQGRDVQAIAHLQKMPKGYETTPYGILANFYLASSMYQECPQTHRSDAQDKQLQEVLARFSLAIKQAQTLMPTLPETMRLALEKQLYLARLQLLEVHFSLGQYAQVRSEAAQLQSELEESGRYPRMWQEASFLQSRTFMLEGKEASAREELGSLLSYSQRLHCEVGDTYVRALIELAQTHLRNDAFDEAQSLLTKAQVAQGRGASAEALLEILIAKSQLHRKKGEIDNAMIILSSVINENTASSLRIQAMYLRAELYELKGRRDLAIRQLQAAALKGGEWGSRSSLKLEEKYGYE